MKDPQRNYVIAGGFVLAMLIALVLVLQTIAGRTGPTRDYYATFDNVTGILTGTKVLYEGFDVGQVKEIGLDDIRPEETRKERPVAREKLGRFMMRLAVQKDLSIPKGSTARIVAPGLLAAFTVDLKAPLAAPDPSATDPSAPAPDASATPTAHASAGTQDASLEEGAVIPGTTTGSLVEALTSVGDTVKDLAENDLKPLLRTINQKAPGLLEHVDQLTNELLTAAKRVNDVLNDDNRRNVGRILTNLHTTADRAQNLAAELRTVVGKVDAMITDNRGHVDQALAALAYDLQTVANRIDSIVENIDGMSRNLNEFGGQIRENPAVLLRGKSRASQAGDGRQ